MHPSIRSEFKMAGIPITYTHSITGRSTWQAISLIFRLSAVSPAQIWVFGLFWICQLPPTQIWVFGVIGNWQLPPTQIWEFEEIGGTCFFYLAYL